MPHGAALTGHGMMPCTCLQEVIKASKASVANGKTAALAALEERDDARSRLDTAHKAHQKAKERHKLAINAELVLASALLCSGMSCFLQGGALSKAQKAHAERSLPSSADLDIWCK